MKKTSSIIIVILSAVIFLLPIAFTKLSGGEMSETEKRYLAPLPTILTEDNSINPSFLSEAKEWFTDHVGFRQEFTEISGNIKMNVFKQSPNYQVHIGDEGWYYYTMDNNLELSTGEYPLTDETLESILEQQLAIQEKLASKGIKYVLVLPTSKVSIYPEYTRYSSCQEVRKTAVDIVADYLEANSDIHVVRIKDALLKDKEENNQQLYFKTDTHWNQYGAFIGYQEINSKLNEWDIIDTGVPNVSFYDSEYVGEFGAMLGNTNFLAPEPTVNTTINNASAVRDLYSEKYLGTTGILNNMGFNYPVYYYQNNTVENNVALVFGDSMFGSWNMTELLAENFSELTYVWNTNIYGEIVDYIQPNVVICEIAERYLNQLPQRSRSFICTPLPDYNAEFISTNVTDEGIEVIVRNNSSSEWTEFNGIRCGLFNNQSDSGYRGYIDSDVTVKPGDTYSFFIPIDCSDLDISSLSVQMLQEGIAYFGPKVSVQYDSSAAVNDAEIVSNTAPATVNHTDSYSIDIMVRNTGTTTWDRDANYRLCIWQDGQDWGYRLILPDGVSVNPGEEYTFTLEGFVLPEATQTTLEFQMLIEGVCYFGEREPAVITSSD